MKDIDDATIQALQRADASLRGRARRLFRGAVAALACNGSARATERWFGWARDAVARGTNDLFSKGAVPEANGNHGRRRSEEKTPKLALDIKALLDPRSRPAPAGKKPWRIITLSAAAVRALLQTEMGYTEDKLPSTRTLRDVLRRLGFRRKRTRRTSLILPSGTTGVIVLAPGALAGQGNHGPAAGQRLIDVAGRLHEPAAAAPLALPAPEPEKADVAEPPAALAMAEPAAEVLPGGRLAVPSPGAATEAQSAVAPEGEDSDAAEMVDPASVVGSTRGGQSSGANGEMR